MQLLGEEGVVEYYMRCLENRRPSPHTITGYRYIISLMARLLSDLCSVTELEEVTILHLRRCVQHLLTVPTQGRTGRPRGSSSVLSASSVCTHIARWKTFFNWCFKEELIEKDPSVRLEFPHTDEKMIDVFTEQQVEQMMDVFNLSTERGFRDYVIILLMLDTGIRRAEVTTLKVEDVHDTYISVFGKGRKERQVGIHPEIGKLVWKYIHKYRRPACPDELALFLSVGRGHNGKPFTRGGMQWLMCCLKRETGIDEVRLSSHTFRHTFACMYLDEGGDLFSLSREMGHTDINTTQKYLRRFTSKNARMHHNAHSPINRIKLRSSRKGKGASKPEKK